MVAPRTWLWLTLLLAVSVPEQPQQQHCGLAEAKAAESEEPTATTAATTTTPTTPPPRVDRPVDWVDDGRRDCSRSPRHDNVVATLLLMFPGIERAPTAMRYNNLTGDEFVGFNKERALSCVVLAQQRILARHYPTSDYLLLYDGLRDEVVQKLCAMGILMRPLLRVPMTLNTTRNLHFGQVANLRKLHIFGLTEWKRAMFIDLDAFPLAGALQNIKKSWLLEDAVPEAPKPNSNTASGGEAQEERGAAAATDEHARNEPPPDRRSLMGLLDLDGKGLAHMQKRAGGWNAVCHPKWKCAGLTFGRLMRCVQPDGPSPLTPQELSTGNASSSSSNAIGTISGESIEHPPFMASCSEHRAPVDMICVAGDAGKAPCHGANFAVRPSARALRAALAAVLNGTFSFRTGWNDVGTIHPELAIAGHTGWDFVGSHVDQGLLFYIGAYVLRSYALVGKRTDLPIQHAAGGSKPWQVKTYQSAGYSARKRELPWKVFWGGMKDVMEAPMRVAEAISGGGEGSHDGEEPACLEDWRELYERRALWGPPHKLRDVKCGSPGRQNLVPRNRTGAVPAIDGGEGGSADGDGAGGGPVLVPPEGCPLLSKEELCYNEDLRKEIRPRLRKTAKPCPGSPAEAAMQEARDNGTAPPFSWNMGQPCYHEGPMEVWPHFRQGAKPCPNSPAEARSEANAEATTTTRR